MSVQANIKAANESRAKVKAHCMAAYVKEDKAHLLVEFPAGFSLGGVRVSTANGIVWACDKAIEKMELIWNENKV